MKKFIKASIILGLFLYTIAFFVYCSAFIFAGARETICNVGFGFLSTGFFVWVLDVVLIYIEKRNEGRRH